VSTKSGQLQLEAYAETKELRASAAFTALLQEAAQISNQHYASSFDLDRRGLGSRAAFMPTAEQRREFAAAHRNERGMYFGDRQPTFDNLLQRLEPLRDLLPG
jgi:hypothetical protein